MTPPTAMPPAIVQPMQVAQASPTVPIHRNAAGQVVPPTVQIPLDTIRDDQRIRDITPLAICANFVSPHKGTNLTKATPAVAKEALVKGQGCLATVEKATHNGTITDLPALTLALRSIPFTNPQGNDNVAETLDDIATQIATAPKGTLKLDYHLNGLGAGLVSTPFTSKELGAATIVDGRKALPTMLPNRNIPIDPSTSYIMTAADVVVHPARYTAAGKTLEETVDAARKRHPAAEDKQLATLCMVNDGSLTLKDCQEVSGRNTLEMVAKGQTRPYNPEFYTRRVNTAQR